MSSNPGSHIDLEQAFVRLPRPQRVLDPAKLLVPTRSALLQAQVHANLRQHEKLSPMPPPPRPRPTTPPPSSSIAAPTSNATLVESSASEPTIRTLEDPIDLHSLGPLITLGTLTQDNTEWSLRAQRGRKGLVMVKRVEYVKGLREKQVIGDLNHRHVAKLVHTFVDEDVLCLTIEYCRITLAEMLFVHLKMEEEQVHYIARSVSDPVLHVYLNN
jgi:hypothetical protein